MKDILTLFIPHSISNNKQEYQLGSTQNMNHNGEFLQFFDYYIDYYNYIYDYHHSWNKFSLQPDRRGSLDDGHSPIQWHACHKFLH